ncbi:hypothetical protein K443DRAFT_501863 [Laccaria amethystina LaAM-08-1]|uniref:Uncharacterized protein n=1 Tax=Laccaria amethystina LaAM-08-1 TaxID=1095629 RepID=A0A0C9XDM8_9AGAR|nr:hypothetical protein K443DRAFT_501863 [Laccaria amethystina LaAM-08-1]
MPAVLCVGPHKDVYKLWFPHRNLIWQFLDPFLVSSARNLAPFHRLVTYHVL